MVLEFARLLRNLVERDRDFPILINVRREKRASGNRERSFYTLLDVASGENFDVVITPVTIIIRDNDCTTKVFRMNPIEASTAFADFPTRRFIIYARDRVNRPTRINYSKIMLTINSHIQATS